ncbi:aquaporin [Xinfangfangia sp. CPCC 101601]|uniref:Aquaporin n=1 Tax=Pseudogemmobacter lacusdianii TaxID=3069608 RepID=A0ABU0VX33_9RHOB|nr:aquaporin [Xinfangfangia sp. CPCC 101601]MDQ2066320.1 aquaporin [Xinfangfangia sp. CPCC 101601]
MLTARKLLAEGIGTGFLAIAAIGAGVMAQGLTSDPGLALLANGIASGLALYIIITVMIPVSGGHVNPVITLTFALRGEFPPGQALAYMAVQICGALIGVALVHAMFDQPLLQWSETIRSGWPLWFAEALATFGLVFVTLGGIAARANVPAIVGAYVAAGYWFTASSAFTNPAITVARVFTEAPGGLRAADLPPYLIAEALGALAAIALGSWLFLPKTPAQSN